MSKLTQITIIMLLIIVAGCTNDSNEKWFDTKEQAIQYGFEQHFDGGNVDIFGEYSIEGQDFIVFYIKGRQAIGAANIAIKNEQYLYYQPQPIVDPGDTEPFSWAKTIFTDLNGNKHLLVLGKVINSKMDSIKIIESGNARKIPIDQITQCFYYYTVNTDANIEIPRKNF